MYAVRWNEEKVGKGLAIAVVLAMIGMAVMPTGIVEAKYYLISKYVWKDNPDPSIRDDGSAAATVGAALLTAGGITYAAGKAAEIAILMALGVGVGVVGVAFVGVGAGLLA